MALYLLFYLNFDKKIPFATNININDSNRNESFRATIFAQLYQKLKS